MLIQQSELPLEVAEKWLRNKEFRVRENTVENLKTASRKIC